MHTVLRRLPLCAAPTSGTLPSLQGMSQGFPRYAPHTSGQQEEAMPGCPDQCSERCHTGKGQVKPVETASSRKVAKPSSTACRRDSRTGKVGGGVPAPAASTCLRGWDRHPIFENDWMTVGSPDGDTNGTCSSDVVSLLKEINASPVTSENVLGGSSWPGNCCFLHTCWESPAEALLFWLPRLSGHLCCPTSRGHQLS